MYIIKIYTNTRIMYTSINLYSNKENEINDFLTKYYNTSLDIDDKLCWEIRFNNPIEMADIIGTYLDNLSNFSISMWISLDKDIYIKITENNGDDLIKYLYQRYPY